LQNIFNTTYLLTESNDNVSEQQGGKESREVDLHRVRVAYWLTQNINYDRISIFSQQKLHNFVQNSGLDDCVAL
jgi:hypothetical protein